MDSVSVYSCLFREVPNNVRICHVLLPQDGEYNNEESNRSVYGQGSYLLLALICFFLSLSGDDGSYKPKVSVVV